MKLTKLTVSPLNYRSYKSNYKTMRIASLTGVALVCLGSLPIHSFAQDKPTPVRPDYKIGIGDILTILVLEDAKISGEQVVTSDGKISFTFLGSIKVEGRTVESVRQQIAKALKDGKLYRNPTVTVSVRPINKGQINVVGTGVKTPGRLPLLPDWRVLDAVTAAGGLGSNRYELFEITLIKTRKGVTYSIDPANLFSDKPDRSINYLLDEDDTLKVDLKKEELTQIQVIGDVRTPGPVISPRDGSIITVLNAVGGPNKTAKLSKSIINRNGKEISINLLGYDQAGWKAPQTLEPGDKLIIPENKDFYTITGENANPGRIPYPEDRVVTVSKAIKDVTGLSLGSVNLKKVVLTRTEKGDTEKYVIDLERILKKGINDEDMIVKPDDTIYLPAKSASNSNAFFEGIQKLSTVLGVFYVLRTLRK